MVTLQPKALEHVIELMVEGGLTPDTHNLRVGVKGGVKMASVNIFE